jgi:hypothetical protein
MPAPPPAGKPAAAGNTREPGTRPGSGDAPPAASTGTAAGPDEQDAGAAGDFITTIGDEDDGNYVPL